MNDRIQRAPLAGAVGAIWLLAAPVLSQTLPQARGTGPPGAAYAYPLYTESTSTQDFNVEVTRGMVRSPDGTRAYAINSYAGAVLEFDTEGLSGGAPIEPLRTWQTIPGPVAIGYYGGRVYVLGQGTHALASHDTATGQFTDVFVPEAPAGAPTESPRGFSEPGDLVIDAEAGEAYVSCMGSDSVFRIDIGEPVMEEIERWRCTSDSATSDFLLKRPRFLCWHEGSLYVAPFLSGNNTTLFMEGVENHARHGSGHRSTEILDGYNPAHLQNGGFPDVDLVRITPSAGAGSAQIEPVFRRAGNLLTGHGIHPTTGEHWMLGIESSNLSHTTEPDFQGDFARNVLARHLPPTAGAPVTLDPATDLTDIDLPFGGTAYAADHSLPFPYAIEFGGPGGRVAVASSNLSRIALRTDGGTHAEFIPPAGASAPDWKVVRDLMFMGAGQAATLWIYCQGTSEIVVWPIPNGAPGGSPTARLNLHSDPTPEAIASGRSIFYDATRSSHSRSTCATCHPGGESDMTIWPLEDGILDYKDPMVTQPLKGLRETFPYHWRGERALHDFNDAFVGLLGADRPLGTPKEPQFGETQELADFESFLFSLRPAGNPRALLTRRLPDVTAVPGETAPTQLPLLTGSPASYGAASPAAGQAKFLGSTCNQCHMLPTGSIGSFAPDNELTDVSQTSRAVHMETIQLSNFLSARDQAMVTVTSAANGKEITRPFLGSGTMHSGGRPSFYQLLRGRFGEVFKLSNTPPRRYEEGAANGAAFVLCLDTGTPPAAHHAVMVNRIGTEGAIDEVRRTLLDQAARGWIDVVVIGESDMGTGALERRSWLYEPKTRLFRPDDGSAPRPLAFFEALAPPVNHLRQNAFLGAPRGTGERIALDFDGDGLRNHLEAGADAWEKDRDGDGWPDGHEAARTPAGTSQGDPDDPAQTSASGDAVAPAIAKGGSLRALLVRASHAEFSFEANEDVEWSLTAKADHGQVTASGTGFARRQTAHLHGLRSGTNYSLRLRLEDRAGNVSYPKLRRDQSSVNSITTLPNRAGLGPGALGDSAIITGLQAVPGTAGPSAFGYGATVAVTVGDLEDPHQAPMGGWTVIGQVSTQDPATGKWILADAADLSVTGAVNVTGSSSTAQSPRPISDLWMGAPYPVAPFSATGPASPGPLLVLRPTGATGTAEVRIDVRTVTPRPIAFSVIEVLRDADNQGTSASPRYMERADFQRWVLPATAPKHRALVLIP